MSWKPGTGATNYTIHQSTVSGGPYTQVGSTMATRYTVSGLVSRGVYFHVVRSQNAFGSSVNSNEVRGSAK